MTYGNDLTVGPIPALVRKLSLPVIVGFFFNTMFNVVDTYFGGKVSTEALTALSFSFPVFFLIIMLNSGVSTGVTAIVSNILGAKEYTGVRHYAAQAVSLSLMISAGLTLVGLLVSPALFRLLGAEGVSLELALQYINIIFIGSVFFMMAGVLNALLQSGGDTHSYRNVLVVGCLANIILDPWFLYGGLGLPAIGWRGIALATILIELFSMCYLGYRVWRIGLIGTTLFQEMKPDMKAYRTILAQALPATLNMATIGIGIFVITYFVGKFGPNAVAAYGIATRIEQIALLPTIGITVACMTLAGQNNGAARFGRVRDIFRVSLRFGFEIMLAGGLVVFMLAQPLMSFFTTNEEVIAIGAHYLSIASFIFLAYATLFTSVSLLQGLKRPLPAVYVGLYRQIVAPVIVFSGLLSFTNLGIDAIWWGVFGVTWSAAVGMFIYARMILRRLPEGDA